MGKYLLHSLKYFITLLALLAAIYFLMYLTGTLGISTADLMGRRGAILLVSIVVLALAYPSFGFVSRTVTVDFTADREAIGKAFNQNGYTLQKEGSDRLVYRASAPLKRLLSLWDDAVTVVPDNNGGIVVSGKRKDVVQICFRIESYTKYR